jgi:hypothetical protein
VLAYVKFGFPPPLLGTYGCEVLSGDDCGVKESFHRVIKDQIHLVFTRNEGVEDGRVSEQSNDGSGDELLYGEEWWQCDNCSEMGRLVVKADLLKCLSILYKQGDQ